MNNHVKIPSTNGKGASIYVVSLFTILAVIVGAAIHHFSTAYLAKQQRRSELRQESYATLLALKVPWCSAVTQLDTAILMKKFYDARLQYSSEKKQMSDFANAELNRAFRIAEKRLELQSDVFRALAQAFIAYNIDEEIEKAINDIINIKDFKVQDLGNKHASDEDLERLKNERAEQISKRVNDEYMQKVNTLLKLLRSQLKE